MKKLSNLFENDVRIVQKRKLIFLIPVCFALLAVIMGIVFHFTSGSALNLGMDFTGGYTINVGVGANLNASNVDDYKKRVTEIVEGYKDEEGNLYGLKSAISVMGEDDDLSLQVKFKSVADDDTMEEIVNGIVALLEDEVTVIRPTLSSEGSLAVFTYNSPVHSFEDEIKAKVAAIEGASVSSLNFGDEKSRSVSFTYTGSLSNEQLIEAMSLDDKYNATVYTNGKVGATVSQDLLYNALAAILIALVLMLVYIGIRFELKSGISAIVALIHDLIVMFAFMIIFHVEFNSTFIAALITILGYSINNSIILFDRVRSNLRTSGEKDMFSLANKSIKQSFVRCLNTTITTVIMIGSVALVCAIASIYNGDLYQMVTFSLPIIVGLLSGFYSAMFVAPSVWVSLGQAGREKPVLAEAKD